MENPEKVKSDSGLSSYGSALRTAGPLLTSGLQMAVAICLMGFVGYLLDQHWGTTPWLLVVGIFFGACAGMYLLIKTANAVDQKDTQRQKKDSI